MSLSSDWCSTEESKAGAEILSIVLQEKRESCVYVLVSFSY